MTTPRGEMLVVGPDSAFQLKLISLNPFEFVGSGMEVKDTSSTVKSVRSTPEFGFRPLTETDIQGLVAAIFSVGQFLPGLILVLLVEM